MSSTMAVGTKRRREPEENVESAVTAIKKQKESAHDETIENSNVRTKLTLASKITQAALERGVKMSRQPGVTSKEICEDCDKLIRELSEKEFIKTVDPVVKSRISKGLCFPTTVSINNVVCNYSSFNEEQKINAHDVVKISVGCHIDGYPTMASRTTYIPEQSASESEDTERFSPEVLLQNRRLALIIACNEALEKAVEQLQPGSTSHDIRAVIESVAKKYNVTALPNALSHEMKRFVLNGRSAFFSRSYEDIEKDTNEFSIEIGKIYHIDVLFGTIDKPSATRVDDVFAFPTHLHQMTSSDEKKLYDLVPSDVHATTLFARNIYQKPIRPNVANKAMGIIKEKFLTFPFIGRTIFEDSEIKSAMGVKSLVENHLLDAFPVLESKKHVTTARACCTVIVAENKTQVMCGDVQGLYDADQMAEIRSASRSILKNVAKEEHEDKIYAKIVGPLQALANDLD